jgi:hypothetical protein
MLQTNKKESTIHCTDKSLAKTLGFYDNSQFWLFNHEALSLIERNRKIHPDIQSREEAYALLNVDSNLYAVYQHFVRLGFIVWVPSQYRPKKQELKGWQKWIHHCLLLLRELFQLFKNSTTQKMPDLLVFKPNSKFKRSNPGSPHFVIHIQ